MARFLLHAVGKDRPGIVAAVTTVLATIGCNLEDSRMTILRGQFAMMLVLDSPGVDDAAAIEASLAPTALELGLLIAILPVTHAPLVAQEVTQAAVSVHGADHPGIVARIAEAIAARGGNIVDLATLVVGETSPSYVMVLSVELAPPLSVEQLDRALAPVAGELGVHCAVVSGDADLL